MTANRDQASPVRALIVDFDADSSRTASSGNLHFWNEVCKVPIETAIQREWGYYVPAAVGLTVRGLAERGLLPLLLGGGHSLTYFAVAELCHAFGPINVLHFDAHHDRYAVDRLSHYSVMNRIQTDLPVAVHSIGVRFEAERAVPVRRPAYAGAPWYVSVDVDFFAPSLVGGVMHPVEVGGKGVDIEGLLSIVRRTVADSRIAGADIVEWIESRATEPERQFITRLLESMVQELESRPCS